MQSNVYIGIDLGTSSVKLLAVRTDGSIAAAETRSYAVSYPAPGYSEQAPEDWWTAVCEGLKALTAKLDQPVGGVAVGGQMHGLVVLDETDAVIRPCILWNDGRTAEETAWLNTEVGRETLVRETGNIAFAGFTAPKLLWMKKHEPENFARIRKIMLPKDYITYRLSGAFVTEYSDAAGTLLLNVKEKRWSDVMCSLCGVDADRLPALRESADAVGAVTPEAAAATGLPAGVPVAAGAGDNAAAAVGTGTVHGGDCNLSIGTSGTLFIAADSYPAGIDPAVHTFCHANGAFHVMGCILSAASCNSWFAGEVLRETDFAAMQAKIPADLPGNNDVYFLPYLTGERSPINDTAARGTFIGLRPDTGREHMLLAVMEGVAFAIRDTLETVRNAGLSVAKTSVTGGGARSGLWLQIFADVLNMPLEKPATEEGPGYGAAILAMTAAGVFGSVNAGADAFRQVRETVYPDPARAALYEARYRAFCRIYPALKPVFAQLYG